MDRQFRVLAVRTGGCRGFPTLDESRFGSVMQFCASLGRRTAQWPLIWQLKVANLRVYQVL
jgi:hypothetical protein